MKAVLILAAFLGWCFAFVVWGCYAPANTVEISRARYPKWFVELSEKNRQRIILGTGWTLVLAPIIAIYLWNHI